VEGERATRGVGLRMVLAHGLFFDPRAENWYPP
jgi:hypothetical protein